ncbi:hypothetical protein [Mesobacillus subterraneus]|uniref:hypothetical protein n=1 Tax=Mesobacillus subterraneus TaxID=285983 RepID=UPI001473BAE0|nr:hypothetical protein [Mesobacillus subterraneus]
MKFLIAVPFILLGSILVGSTVDQLNPLENGLLRATGAVFLILGVFIATRKNSKK